MSEPASPPKSDRRALIEAIIASTVGTTIEWYDFFLYGTAAALIFPDLFFPTLDPFASQLASFGTFTVGFIARPFGGVFFGWMGDRIGRKSTLVATLLLMGVSTMLMGILPTYDQIGVLAPLLLVLLRFCQGLGVGGEWGGAVLLALEYGHRGKRGFYASWPQAGVPLGLLGSTAVFAFFRGVLSAEQFNSWGWRVPFLLSGVLIAVGLIIRQRIAETPLFDELVRTKQVSSSPVWETLRHHGWAVVLAGGARVVENASFYLFTVHAMAYATRDLAQSPDEAKRLEQAVFWGTNLGAAISFFMIPLYGVLSDWWSRRGMYVLGCVLMIAIAWPFYAVMQARDPTGILVMIVVALVFGHAMLYSVQASLIPELFGTRLRYTGASIGYQLAAPFAGGVAPLIAASLVKWSGSAWPLAVYVTLMALLSLGCVLLLAETSRKDITA